MADHTTPAHAVSPFTDSQLAALRAEFPSLQHTIHLANCSQGAQSYRVRAAVETYLENWLSAGADWDYWVAEVDRAKAAFALLINCEPDDVAVMGSLSEAMAKVAGALDYSGSRNRILLTESEFPTVGHVWLAHRRYGADVGFVAGRGSGVGLQDLERVVDDRTLLVCATHVSYQTGHKQDLRQVAELVHGRGALLFVDAYQGLGTCCVDVRHSEVDFLASGNLKYLLGMPGIAFMYVRPGLVPSLEPSATGWFGQHNPFAFDLKTLDYARTARRFEGGTPPVPAAFAARAGIELVLEVGLERIGQHIDYLSALCLRRALERGLDVMSPRDVAQKGATTAIRVDGDTHAVEIELKRRGIVTAARGAAIRIAPHYYNTAADVDTAIEALTDVVFG